MLPSQQCHYIYTASISSVGGVGSCRRSQHGFGPERDGRGITYRYNGISLDQNTGFCPYELQPARPNELLLAAIFQVDVGATVQHDFVLAILKGKDSVHDVLS